MHDLRIQTIKVTQQTAVGALNIVDTARQILAKNGPMGFYQGVVPYLTADGIRYSPTNQKYPRMSS